MTKKKTSKYYCTQQVGILEDEVIVMVGYNCEEYNGIINKLLKDKEDGETSIAGLCMQQGWFDNCKAFLAYHKESRRLAIWLKEFSTELQHLDLLSHEIYHLVDYVSIDKMFTGEHEFKAYLHEHLNRELRNKLVKGLSLKWS